MTPPATLADLGRFLPDLSQVLSELRARPSDHDRDRLEDRASLLIAMLQKKADQNRRKAGEKSRSTGAQFSANDGRCGGLGQSARPVAGLRSERTIEQDFLRAWLRRPDRIGLVSSRLCHGLGRNTWLRILPWSSADRR